jgi:hypothetical protein
MAFKGELPGPMSFVMSVFEILHKISLSLGSEVCFQRVFVLAWPGTNTTLPFLD